MREREREREREPGQEPEPEPEPEPPHRSTTGCRPAREPEPVQETKINCEHHAKRVSASELQMVEKLDRALCENRALKAVVKALLDSERVTV